MQQVIEHLTGLGHRRIAHVVAVDAIAADQFGLRRRHRRRGSGLEVDVIKGGRTERSGSTPRQLLPLPELPSAVTVFNDQCALGVLDRLSRAGVDVPGRVLLVATTTARCPGWPTSA